MVILAIFGWLNGENGTKQRKIFRKNERAYKGLQKRKIEELWKIVK